MSVRVLIGDCRDRLRELPDQSVQCVVTSPPYFGLRDYGVEGQLGAEPTPQEFVAALREVFREVWRVLRDDGTVWLNLGDTYMPQNYGRNSKRRRDSAGSEESIQGKANHWHSDRDGARSVELFRGCKSEGLKQKDLIGIPWRVAFALQDDGWYLRQDIIWHKPNPMPESVRDRCTKAHEYLFMLTKSPRYYFDSEAIKESADKGASGSVFHSGKSGTHQQGRSSTADRDESDSRNKRSVWTVSTRPYAGAHFATFPPALVEPCIRAGTAAGDTVLDPFAGSGTTGYVADYLQRDAVLIEMNPEYADLIRKRLRCGDDMFSEVEISE